MKKATKEVIEEYYVFTLVFIVLAISLFVFRNSKEVSNIIIGGFIGLISAPAIVPRGDSFPENTDKK